MQRYRLTKSGVCDCMLPDDNGPWVKYEDAEQAHRDATEEVAKAHKRGWEQAKRECMDKILDSAMHDISIQPSFTYRGIANMIAAMEYKEKAND